MTEDEIKAEIAEQVRLAKEAAQPFTERADYLRKVLEGPRVTPFLHYWRYGTKNENEHWENDLVGAFRYLRHLGCEGIGSAVGVSVGGHLITCDEWENDPRNPGEVIDDD